MPPKPRDNEVVATEAFSAPLRGQTAHVAYIDREVPLGPSLEERIGQVFLEGATLGMGSILHYLRVLGNNDPIEDVARVVDRMVEFGRLTVEPGIGYRLTQAARPPQSFVELVRRVLVSQDWTTLNDFYARMVLEGWEPPLVREGMDVERTRRLLLGNQARRLPMIETEGRMYPNIRFRLRAVDVYGDPPIAIQDVLSAMGRDLLSAAEVLERLRSAPNPTFNYRGDPEPLMESLLVLLQDRRFEGRRLERDGVSALWRVRLEQAAVVDESGSGYATLGSEILAVVWGDGPAEWLTVTEIHDRLDGQEFWTAARVDEALKLGFRSGALERGVRGGIVTCYRPIATGDHRPTAWERLTGDSDL